MASFKVNLKFWEQNKVARTQIRGVWGMWNHRNALFSQKFVHRDHHVTRGIVVMEHPIVRNSWSHANNSFS